MAIKTRKTIYSYSFPIFSYVFLCSPVGNMENTGQSPLWGLKRFKGQLLPSLQQMGKPMISVNTFLLIIIRTFNGAQKRGL